MPKNCENELYKTEKHFSVGGIKSVHIIIIVATGAVALLGILLVAVAVVKKG